MNPLGINLWNWCAGLSEECLGLPEKVARMGFTAVEDVYKRQAMMIAGTSGICALTTKSPEA